MGWKCPKCEHAHDEPAPLFGHDAICESCGARFETDWEYTDPYEGCFTSWIVREKEPWEDGN